MVDIPESVSLQQVSLTCHGAVEAVPIRSFATAGKVNDREWIKFTKHITSRKSTFDQEQRNTHDQGLAKGPLENVIIVAEMKAVS